MGILAAEGSVVLLWVTTLAAPEDLVVLDSLLVDVGAL